MKTTEANERQMRREHPPEIWVCVWPVAGRGYRVEGRIGYWTGPGSASKWEALEPEYTHGHVTHYCLPLARDEQATYRAKREADQTADAAVKRMKDLGWKATRVYPNAYF